MVMDKAHMRFSLLLLMSSARITHAACYERFDVPCSDSALPLWIKTESECMEAVSALGLTWWMTFDSVANAPYCQVAGAGAFNSHGGAATGSCVDDFGLPGDPGVCICEASCPSPAAPPSLPPSLPPSNPDPAPPSLPPSSPPVPISVHCGCDNTHNANFDIHQPLCVKVTAGQRVCYPLYGGPTATCPRDTWKCTRDSAVCQDMSGVWASKKCAKKARKNKCRKRRVQRNCPATCGQC